jgi:Tfp pilus assembly protein PilV
MLKAGLWNAETSIATPHLVTMRTFSARLRVHGRSLIGASARSVVNISRWLPSTRPQLVRPDRYHATPQGPLTSEVGDTLMEVIVSALLLAVIVVGALTGINSANRATSLDRARSQADALAQQDEDQLRSEPINKLSELSETHEAVLHEVSAGGTTYTISSTAKYVADTTATASCTSTSEKADYIQTASKVTWNALGTGKPVVETSIISPPADSALIVQVTGASGEAVSNMNVTATGPTNISTTTSTDGCAILAVLPGEYKLNVNRSGYVDQNGYENSDLDPPISNSSLYVVAETTIKKSYEFAPAGTLEVSFENSSTKLSAEGDSFVAVNTTMNPTFRAFGTVGTYSSKIASPTTIFPFTSNKYSIYAGTCEADNPHVVNPANGEPTAVSVLPGKTSTATAALPPIKIKVMSGTSKSARGIAVANAPVTLTDTQCSTKRETKTNSKGELEHPLSAFGQYSLCVTGGSSGVAANRRYITTFTNNTINGPSEAATMTNAKELSEGAAVIYMGVGAAISPGTLESGETCP